MFTIHPNGGTIFKDVKGYASKGTIKSMKEGTIHNLITEFEKSFNGAFAKELHEITDVDTKIDYLEEIKKLAKESTTITDFEDKVKEKYPEYSGLNYLDMTAGFFFPQN